MCFYIIYECDLDCNKSQIFEPATISEHTFPQPEIIIINIENELRFEAFTVSKCAKTFSGNEL
jgi:hypothetical protein